MSRRSRPAGNPEVLDIGFNADELEALDRGPEEYPNGRKVDP